MISTQVHLRAHPEGPVGPEHFDLVEVDLPEPGPGEVLVRNTWLSVDPSLRLRLRVEAPKGYFPSFPLGAPMDGILTVGVVEASGSDSFAVGDTVVHSLGWRSHSLVDAGADSMGGVGTLRVVDAERFPPQWHRGPRGAQGGSADAGV